MGLVASVDFASDAHGICVLFQHKHYAEIRRSMDSLCRLGRVGRFLRARDCRFFISLEKYLGSRCRHRIRL